VRERPWVLLVAGLDPSGGAGLSADLWALSAVGARGYPVAAALTAQGTRGARAFEPVPPAFLRRQIEALLDGAGPAARPRAVKSGMLGTGANAAALARLLARGPLARVPLVVDPVLAATSGLPLLRARSARAALGPLLVDAALPKYGQNIKYDALVLARAGVELAGIGFDTMVASYVINPTRHQHNLAELALEYLNEQVTTYQDVAGSGKKQISFAEVEVEKARDYSGEDADVAFRLTRLLAPKLEELGFHALFYDLELPLVAVLARMERNGVRIDSQRLRDGSKEADVQLQELMRRIWAIAGVEFNINSPKQLGEILFDKLGLPVVRRTKTGRSTDEDVLTRLAASHELPAEILAWRSLAKLKNTYLDVLPTLVNPETGRVHTSFNQTVTATGRLSSSDPNLQNIPVRTELGRRIRESFTAAPGSILVSADYSQIELRIMAHLSGDAELCDSFRRGEDIHARTAALMFGLDAAAVSGEQRRAAKTGCPTKALRTLRG